MVLNKVQANLILNSAFFYFINHGFHQCAIFRDFPRRYPEAMKAGIRKHIRIVRTKECFPTLIRKNRMPENHLVTYQPRGKYNSESYTKKQGCFETFLPEKVQY